MPIDFEPIDSAPVIDFEPVAEAAPAPEPETDSWAEVVGKSVIQGLVSVPTSIGATSRFVNDLLGLDFLNQSGDLYDISKEAARFWEPKTEGSEAKRHTTNIIRTIGEIGSTAALAIPTGGAGALLPTIATGAGAQKYAEAKGEGASFEQAASAGLLQGEIELLTEKIPLGVLLKPGLSFGRRLAMGLVTDVPGELMATAGEMALVDTQYLGKRYTLDQYLQALKDTAITAAGVTGGMTAISHPLVKQVEAFQEQVKKEPERYEEIFTGGIKAMTEEAPDQAAPEVAALTEADVTEFQPEPIPDLTTEEAVIVEQATIETDTAAESAAFDLVAEGASLDTLTEEAIQAKVQSFEQGPFNQGEAALKMQGGVEAGASLEQRATSSVEGQTPIYKAVYDQLKVAMPKDMPETDIQAQAALWDSFFRTMGERAGVEPMELYGKYKPTIEREAARRQLVNDDGSLNLTKSQKTTLELVRQEVEAGEAGTRHFREGELGGDQVVTAIPSSFPDYFQNKGYTKKETLAAIDKALAGEKLGKRQLSIVLDLNEGYRQQTSEQLKKARTEGRMEDPETGEMISAKEWEKRYFQATRGRITFGPEGVNIELLKNADPSTFLHETGHFYLRVLGDLAQAEGASASLKKDLNTILKWLGVGSVDKIETKHHEKFARGFEKYLAEGNAPSQALKSAFDQFKAWLIQVYKSLRALNVTLTKEVRSVMDRMVATEEEMKAAARTQEMIDKAGSLKSVLPAGAVKGQVNRAAGVRKVAKLIREDVALRAAWKKAEQSARIAFREGKKEALAKAKVQMQEVVAEAKRKAAEKIEAIRTEKQKIAARRRQINDIVEYLGLNDTQVKKLIKKDIRLMTDFEFMKFKNDLLNKAEALQERDFEKARVREIIDRKRLQKVENYRRVLGYPTIDAMTTEQLREFADVLEEFQDGDVFLTERELETVDRTDLKGIRTWREAKEALAKELGTTPDKLDTIKATAFDGFRWDASLAESNPFYGLLVETTTKSLMNSETRFHEVENKIYELARKSEKSRGRTLVEKLIPQDKQIFEYLEAQAEMKPALAEQMTPEQVELARYMQEYFGQALEYLIKTKAIEKGRENYITHIRRSFLETFKEDGLFSAVLSVFHNYQQDEMVFNILDDDTGNILPLEKFFQFSMRRTGGLEPTQNVVKAFLVYARTFEKKVSLDEIIPKLDIYAQSLTPQTYTPRGLETDRSLKKFVNRYINNKKGRQISFDSFIKQGGPIDLSIRALRTFTTMIDLGLSIPVGMAAFVGERVANFQLLGAKAFALGEKRAHTDKGKTILRKYEAFTGRSVWEEFTAPGKEVTERIVEGMFGLFHQATVSANKQFLLGVLTEEEFNSGEISEKRLAEMRIEMGRWRVVPGAKSIIGSTSIGGAALQYKSWAVVMARTTIKDLTTLLKDLKNKPAGEALTTKEAKELYRAVSLIAVVLIVFGAGDDEKDKSFIGQVRRRIRNESLSILSAISPEMWLATPRIMGFMTQLGKNLTSIIKLEEYKTKPGLKGVGGLKKQLTPGVVRQLTPEEEKGPRARVQ